MTFHTLHDRVPTKRLDAESKTIGAGLRGADGKGVTLDVRTGDRVLSGKCSGTEVKIDGADLLIMTESDIPGVLSA
ncbi:MAG: co-chaperone GroES [Candidatus Thiodiazotropha sp.]